jgi:adenylate cyclase
LNDGELRETLNRIQAIIADEKGTRLGRSGESTLAKILWNVASGNLSGTEGFATREATILLADLRGFTSISAHHPAATVLKLVNRCLITMSEVVFRHQGTIDKFMGDAIMVVFDSQPATLDPAKRAVACAVDLQLAMDELNAHYRQFDLPELFLGIGINTGPVFAGTLGSNFYAAYTVMGNDVNLAARIEGFSLRGQVLISATTFERCGDFIRAGEPMPVQVKGRNDIVTLREVLEIPSLEKSVPRREVRRSPRVKVRTPFSYQVIDVDVTVAGVRRGMIVDIGYHGILAEIDWPCAPMTEMKLEMDLPLVGHKATEVYARTLKIMKEGNSYLCGIEFTSVPAETSRQISALVQLLLQGAERT